MSRRAFILSAIALVIFAFVFVPYALPDTSVGRIRKTITNGPVTYEYTRNDTLRTVVVNVAGLNAGLNGVRDLIAAEAWASGITDMELRIRCIDGAHEGLSRIRRKGANWFYIYEDNGVFENYGEQTTLNLALNAVRDLVAAETWAPKVSDVVIVTNGSLP